MLSLVVGLDVFMSFVRNQETENVFGIELNVWLYRFLWSGLAILLAVNFVKELNQEKSNQK
jgi:hypothetical protein